MAIKVLTPGAIIKSARNVQIMGGDGKLSKPKTIERKSSGQVKALVDAKKAAEQVTTYAANAAKVLSDLGFKGNILKMRDKVRFHVQKTQEKPQQAKQKTTTQKTVPGTSKGRPPERLWTPSGLEDQRRLDKQHEIAERVREQSTAGKHQLRETYKDLEHFYSHLLGENRSQQTRPMGSIERGTRDTLSHVAAGLSIIPIGLGHLMYDAAAKRYAYEVARRYAAQTGNLAAFKQARKEARRAGRLANQHFLRQFDPRTAEGRANTLLVLGGSYIGGRGGTAPQRAMHQMQSHVRLQMPTDTRYSFGAANMPRAVPLADGPVTTGKTLITGQHYRPGFDIPHTGTRQTVLQPYGADPYGVKKGNLLTGKAVYKPKVIVEGGQPGIVPEAANWHAMRQYFGNKQLHHYGLENPVTPGQRYALHMQQRATTRPREAQMTLDDFTIYKPLESTQPTVRVYTDDLGFVPETGGKGIHAVGLEPPSFTHGRTSMGGRGGGKGPHIEDLTPKISEDMVFTPFQGGKGGVRGGIRITPLGAVEPDVRGVQQPHSGPDIHEIMRQNEEITQEQRIQHEMDAGRRGRQRSITRAILAAPEIAIDEPVQNTTWTNKAWREEMTRRHLRRLRYLKRKKRQQRKKKAKAGKRILHRYKENADPWAFIGTKYHPVQRALLSKKYGKLYA